MEALESLVFSIYPSLGTVAWAVALLILAHKRRRSVVVWMLMVFGLIMVPNLVVAIACNGLLGNALYHFMWRSHLMVVPAVVAVVGGPVLVGALFYKAPEMEANPEGLTLPMPLPPGTESGKDI